MKIAICLTGQLRNWRLGWENQKWFWTRNPDFEVDFFAHTWNYSEDREACSKPYIKREVTKEEYQEFIDAFDIKKSIFDDMPVTSFQGSDHWGALFYSLVHSLMLKREYEIENNFTYDLVIKSRPDIVLHPDTFLHPMPYEDGILYSTHGGLMQNEYNMMNFNDCLFLGNSRTMDKLINIFHYRMHKINVEEDNIHPMGPGVLMNEFFRDFGIYSKVGNLGFNEVLLKEGCPENLDLFKSDDFKIMSKYFRDWYTR